MKKIRKECLILVSGICFLAGLFSIGGYLKECGIMRYMSPQENMYCMGKCDDSNDLWVYDGATITYDSNDVTLYVNAIRDSSDPNLTGSITLDPNSGLWTNSLFDTLDEEWLAEYKTSGNKFNYIGFEYGATWDWDVDGSYHDYFTIHGRHRLFQSGSWFLDVQGDATRHNVFGSGDTQWEAGIVTGWRF